VHKMVRWCHSGSPMAQVDDVQVAYETPTGDFSGFHIR
jgi:acylphosphatase